MDHSSLSVHHPAGRRRGKWERLLRPVPGDTHLGLRPKLRPTRADNVNPYWLLYGIRGEDASMKRNTSVGKGFNPGPKGLSANAFAFGSADTHFAPLTSPAASVTPRC